MESRAGNSLASETFLLSLSLSVFQSSGVLSEVPGVGGGGEARIWDSHMVWGMCFLFLRLHLRHGEVPRPGIETEQQLQPVLPLAATLDP